ncbi:MAG: hypothetical protein JW918_20600 [Anaerolineae bacterium]|nr:hypothetical protein [Anaerolineae bacterium]
MNSTLSCILKGIGVFLAAVAVLAYLGYLVVFVLYAVDLFQWPFDYDQGEGFELYDAILYSRGEWPYKDNAVYPFYASNYPPLFHLLIIPLLPVFGPHVVAGRVVSSVATLVIGGTIFFVVRRRVKGWFIPLVSGLAFFASSHVYQTGPLCRMHMTMVMFETLAVAFIAGFDHPKHGTRNLILGLAMLFCAGYTKQMAVFTVVAALSYVFLRDVKKAVVSGVALAVVVGAVFWLLNAATDGQWWVNTIQANVNEFKYLQTIFFLRQWFRLHALLILLAAAYLVYELLWDRLSVYSLWLFFGMGTGLLSGKWGAGFNYFTTAIAAACITSGLALGRLQKAASRRRTMDEQAHSFLDTTAASASLVSGAALGRLKRSLGRRAAAQPLRDTASSAARATRLSPKRARHLFQGRLRKLQPWAAPLLAVIIPLLYLLQASLMLHMPTSGPVFGPLARAFGVADKLVLVEGEAHCRTYQYHDSMGYTQLGHLLVEEDYEAGEEILAYVRTSDGPVFSEEAMFSLLAGEQVVTNPTQLRNLYLNGSLDTTDIVARINRQEFGVVIFRARFYPDPVLVAIGQNYTTVETVCMNSFKYDILLPNRLLADSQAQ